MAIDQTQSTFIYSIVSILFLVVAMLRARVSYEWIGTAISAIVFVLGAILSFSYGNDPDTPTSLLLTCTACLFSGILIGTKFDPINPFIGIGGANKEPEEYLDKDETLEIIGRRGVEIWPGLVLGFTLATLAIIFISFE